MKKQLHLLLVAVMFYTRIPVSSWINYTEQAQKESSVYFPFIGWITAGFSILVFFVSHLVYSESISLIITFILGILLTGALHEDGFADVCDGFGGGWTKEKILEIMKDSRVGVYGVIGLIGLFTLKYALVDQLIDTFKASNLYVHLFFIFILAHTLSRFMALTLMYTHSYARNTPDSKIASIARPLSAKQVLFASVWVIIPFILYIYQTTNLYIMLLPIPILLIKIGIGRYYQKWIGGYTGDCLGALQQVTEIAIYLFFAGIPWKSF
ncbi:adenosylcobinamide-GDP ribazoletransferase [Cytophagaceae bacterium YF14B1]|uniref:Adenosylcobinamide-GDP ribazoletransferase n=1 Tax=Xanthocytophaga flava TaxID=3048013 RepID=A0AAE3UB34_9BACT|nr:adenosylcobinamide-GDP ribazoletransferase [Xanthocytophaga flavus]MDJ1483978.1 adenosylcobinamide-GDP ribazoletransferase [Xanthocytophaga flavus]